ncbi:MAG: energy-coupled thiamine transporter ThiT [Clostridia bacterium]|nr:energy-coupled thiamine transporter ThiT [Clostridia bacterium]
MKIVLQEYILKIFEPRSLIAVFALVLLGVVLIIMSKKTVYNTRTLSYGALSIAAAFVLSYLKILQLPNGGTITVAGMLPLFAFAYIAGPRAGIAAGFAFGLIHYIQEPFPPVHWAQFLLDYPLAFAVLGFAGYLRKNIFLGAVLGSILRLICHFLSGFIFFGSFAPQGMNVYLYSLLYNASYLIPDIIICLLLLAIPNVRVAIKRLKLSV